MAIPREVKKDSLEKWAEPLRMGWTRDGKRREASDSLAAELRAWWHWFGRHRCSMCYHVDRWCSLCPLHTSIWGVVCAEPYDYLRQLVSSHNSTSEEEYEERGNSLPASACGEFLDLCQQMYDLIAAMEVDPEE